MSRDRDYWLQRGQEMVADRQRRIARAKRWKFDTVATHGVYDLEQALNLNNGSIMEPVYLSPAQAYANSAEMETAMAYEMPTWCYSRIANPSTFFLEETAALMEAYGTDTEASCLATSSGMSAIKTATDPFLVRDAALPSPNIVASAKVYGGTFQQFWIRRYEEQGIEVRWVKDPMNLSEWESKVDKNTRFLYGEFPSNPSVEIFDIGDVAEMAHAAGVPLIVDATCASPALTRPLAHGADIVIQSASKVMGGSGSSIVGLVTSRKDIASKVGSDEMKADFAVWAKLWPYRDNGPALNPMAAIMTLNDMRTLRMRVAQMSDNTLQLARYLKEHPKVEDVHYPGLESHRSHDTAKKYMKLVDSNEHKYGYMLSFEIKEQNAGDSVHARKFYDHLQMIWRATDLGRVKTVATLNSISTHQQQGEEGRALADIKPSTCRLACGVENAEDIIADVDQALDRV